jgi:hypothetical protein
MYRHPGCGRTSTHGSRRTQLLAAVDLEDEHAIHGEHVESGESDGGGFGLVCTVSRGSSRCR